MPKVYIAVSEEWFGGGPQGGMPRVFATREAAETWAAAREKEVGLAYSIVETDLEGARPDAAMEPDRRYTGQQMLPLLQRQAPPGAIVVWEDGNLFFKTVTDPTSEFPDRGASAVRGPFPKELDGEEYIVVEGLSSQYDAMWMLATPQAKAHFALPMPIGN